MLATTVTALAREALLLWPRENRHGGDADLWPVFVVAVDDDDIAGNAVASCLKQAHSTVTLLDGVCHWSVITIDDPLLGLRVEAAAPVPVALRIVLPAGPLRSELPLLAAGPTVGLTTVNRARELGNGVDAQLALRSMVLVRSRPAAEVAALALERAS
ncbi:hypothetical protein [Actinokineospora sp. NBRC 105648]|uniref:hypothetical protein n=1 Tax=Actinokineospora sp. NBRC 105648 TaxID=3032206 RepID=UPI0024A1959B|nr:hypothetical protein [Actinokineospora sp. NBRC 105648]GLZ42280.1 hypothetical protein Acsp05_59040 [Actinokineospora sp. NBRC 105648]